jgi:hypothetical protein
VGSSPPEAGGVVELPDGTDSRARGCAPACDLGAELPWWASPIVQEGQCDRRLKKALSRGSHTSASPSHLVEGNLVHSHE